MDSFKIDWKSASEHDLKKITKQYIPKIINAIENFYHPINYDYVVKRPIRLLEFN